MTLQFSAFLQVYHNVITTQNVLYISVESIPSPRPQPSATTNRLSVTLCSFLSTTSSYKWTHTVCCLVYPASFTQHNILKFILCIVYQFWLLSNTPLYGYMIVRLSIPLLMGTWIVSKFWLLWIKLHEPSLMFSFLLSKYLSGFIFLTLPVF